MTEQDPQPANPEEPDAGRQPPVLDYGRAAYPQPELAARAGARGAVAAIGCLYGLLASIFCFGIITAARGAIASLVIAPALLLGVPFFVSLCRRGWRFFAVGIALEFTLVLLILGLCGMMMPHF